MKLLFDQNLSFKLCQTIADLFPESNHVRLLARPPSRQLVISLAEPVQTERKANSLFGGLENDESRGLGGAELAEQLVVHHHFGDAAVGQASDKPGAADIDSVEL